jgi:hypothetical protein
MACYGDSFTLHLFQEHFNEFAVTFIKHDKLTEQVSDGYPCTKHSCATLFHLEQTCVNSFLVGSGTVSPIFGDVRKCSSSYRFLKQ